MTTHPDPHLDPHRDLRDRLELAINEPPPPGAFPDPRTLGRHAVRRRRAAAVGAAAAAVLVVAGVTTWTLGPDRTDRTAEVATDPPAPTPPTTTPTPVPPAPSPSTVFLTEIPVPNPDPGAAATTRLSDDDWADYRADGTLELLPDVRIERRIDDAITTDVQSVALELARPGRADRWYLVELTGGFPLPTSSWNPAGSGWPSLEAWVEHLDQPLVAPSYPPVDGVYGELVTRDDDGVLAATRDARIIEQRTGVDVGAAFAPAADTSAALVTRKGKRFFVLVHTSFGAPDVVTVPQARTGATDLDGFLDYARQQYADGDGLP